MGKAKPFDIPKRIVWEAYKRVKANRGAAGVDDQSIEAFDQDVKNNLFKLWNRLSSGSYFPPPVRTVKIPKKNGGERKLGIPPRSSMTRKGKFFLNFSPAVSNKAAKAIRDQFRSWKLPQRSDKAIDDLSRMFNPIIRGWIHYYGRYYRSALYPTMRELNRDLVLWAKRKYKKLRRHHCRATHWIARISRRAPELFAHWQMGVQRGSMTGAV